MEPTPPSAAAADLDPPGGAWEMDRSGFLPLIAGKADQLRDGYRAGLEAVPEDQAPRGLLFAGMGFSGAGNELVRDACTRAMDVPFTIVRHYQFPHHVKQDWHCLAVSYSGETEETLAVAREAVRRGVGLTTFATGGTLAALGQRNVAQPPGHQPRAAFAHAWGSLLGFLEGSGLLREPVPIEAACRAISDVDAACGPQVPEADNEAKALARRVAWKIPQIYATPAFLGVAHTFRAWLNENAKKIASTQPVPECNHNDLTGWGGDEANRRHFTAVALSHASQNLQIQQRLQYMAQRYTEWDVPWHHRVFGAIDSFAQHLVEQARAVQLLDYTAFYTAMLRGVDPGEIREIEALKRHLRGGAQA